uniref:Uncharacterized protein n=1 Tax=Helicotheca tamesis TaxID=374047 RepID=A0A7S2HX26_9STRA
MSSSSKSCASSVVNTANLKAHTKAMKAKTIHAQQPEPDESSSSSSSDSSSLLQRHHHRSQKRQRISTTTTTYLPSADANLVSSSDRSGSELGTESESAVGSSHGSSAGSGSGSDNGSDNASDQSDTASEENTCSGTKQPVTNMDQSNTCSNGTQNQELSRRELIAVHNALQQPKGTGAPPGSQ